MNQLASVGGISWEQIFECHSIYRIKKLFAPANQIFVSPKNPK